MSVVSGDIDDAELEAVAALSIGYRGVFWGMVVWLEVARILDEGLWLYCFMLYVGLY